jgi:hypothetical protein
MMTDNNGHELSVGDLVCFNASGEIAYGQIVSLDEKDGPDRWGQWTDVKIEIEQKVPEHRISKVGRPSNVMVVLGIPSPGGASTADAAPTQ